MAEIDVVEMLEAAMPVRSFKEADRQRAIAAKNIRRLRAALHSALGAEGVLDNGATMRREVLFNGSVVSWVSAAMIEQERKIGIKHRPFGYYARSRLLNGDFGANA